MSKSKEYHWEMTIEELRKGMNHAWNHASFRADMAVKYAQRHGENDKEELRRIRSATFDAFIEETYNPLVMSYVYIALAGAPRRFYGEDFDPPKTIDDITKLREKQKGLGEISPDKLTPNMMKIIFNNSHISEALDPMECPECFTSIRP